MRNRTYVGLIISAYRRRLRNDGWTLGQARAAGHAILDTLVWKSITDGTPYPANEIRELASHLADEVIDNLPHNQNDYSPRS